MQDPQATVVNREGGRVTLSFDPGVVTAAELIRRITEKHAIRDLFVENPPIEEVIARIYQEDLTIQTTSPSPGAVDASVLECKQSAVFDDTFHTIIVLGLAIEIIVLLPVHLHRE